MGIEERQQCLDDLRLREAQGTLTESERVELEALYAALDAEEAEAMGPGLERMQECQAEAARETARLAIEVRELELVVREQEALLEEAQAYLDRLRTRRAALAGEFQRITGRELTRSQ